MTSSPHDIITSWRWRDALLCCDRRMNWWGIMNNRWPLSSTQHFCLLEPAVNSHQHSTSKLESFSHSQPLRLQWRARVLWQQPGSVNDVRFTYTTGLQRNEATVLNEALSEIALIPVTFSHLAFVLHTLQRCVHRHVVNNWAEREKSNQLTRLRC